MTEATLDRIAASVRAGTLAGKDRIGHRIGKEAGRRKVEKHFDITIEDNTMTWRRRTDRIEDEARLDGIDIVRTSLETIETDRAVDVCKNLANVERAYRNSRSDLPAAAGLCLFAGPRPRTCVPVHAVALCRVAYAPASGTAAVRG